MPRNAVEIAIRDPQNVPVTGMIIRSQPPKIGSPISAKAKTAVMPYTHPYNQMGTARVIGPAGHGIAE